MLTRWSVRKAAHTRCNNDEGASYVCLSRPTRWDRRLGLVRKRLTLDKLERDAHPHRSEVAVFSFGKRESASLAAGNVSPISFDKRGRAMLRGFSPLNFFRCATGLPPIA